MTPAIAFILKGYPRLSETFIAQEILALEHAGLNLHIISLRHPTDRHQHPMIERIQAPVSYLPEYLHLEPLRVIKAWWQLRNSPAYRQARKLFIADLLRDFTRNRFRRFGQALVVAAELPRCIVHLHAHFLHTPASVARYASYLRGLPWSASAHARDIWTSPQWDLQEKLSEAKFVVTCTALNARHLKSLTNDPDRIDLVYHGLDLQRFKRPEPQAKIAHSDSTQAVRLLSVGRAVEKKGYRVLLDALAALPTSLPWQFHHVGDGPLLRSLQQQAIHLGIDKRIHWHGALAQQDVLLQYQCADIFVLNSQVAGDGDMDGLPNVLMEAQSQRLACIATRLSAIPELIEDQVTGVLVTSGEVNELTSAMAALIRDPATRMQMAQAGEHRVRSDFGMQAGITKLLGHFSCLEDME